MSNFVPETEHLRHALLFLFNQKKKASESHRLLVETYGEHSPSKATCERWFNRFKIGDFDLRNEERGRPPKKFENEELQALLEEDCTQTEKQLAEALNVSISTISGHLHAMGKIQKQGKWVNK